LACTWPRYGASRVASAFLFHTCRRHYPGGSARCAFRSLPSQWQPSPHPHQLFRGLLSVHSRYGLHGRQVPFRTFYTRGFSHFVSPMTAPVASGRCESGRAGFAPAGKQRLCTAHPDRLLGSNCSAVIEHRIASAYIRRPERVGKSF
jgi:hypothetical protein